MLTCGILLALSLISFNPDDLSLNVSQNPQFAPKPSNFVGVVGAYGADIFFQLWGYSAFLLPIFLGIYAFCWLASSPVKNFTIRLAGMLCMMCTIATALGMWPVRIRDQILPGGLIGKISADALQSSFNSTGALVLLLSAFLVSLFLSTKFSFTSATAFFKARFRFAAGWSERWSAWQDERVRARAIQAEVKKEKTLKKQSIISERARAAETPTPSETRRETVVAAADEPTRPTIAAKRKAMTVAPSAEFPATTLLHAPPAAIAVDENELRKRAKQIEEKAREFEVAGTVQQIHPGPVVTTFEFKPEPGVKYSRITGLGDDLCLALKPNRSASIEFPGKSTVGMEVPNDDRATIVLRELVESSEYQHANYRLPLALGKDITGKIVVSDLQKMPHLLAAGSTGTGKSVSINAMILSLLFRAGPIR